MALKGSATRKSRNPFENIKTETPHAHGCKHTSIICIHQEEGHTGRETLKRWKVVAENRERFRVTNDKFIEARLGEIQILQSTNKHQNIRCSWLFSF